MDDTIDTIYLDKRVILTCSDGKNILLSQNRLSNFKYFEDELKRVSSVVESPIVASHTSEEMIRMFDFDKDNMLSHEEIPLLTRLYHYYRHNKYWKFDPPELQFINPGSEEYFEESIRECFQSNSRKWHQWRGMEISDKTKAILYDEMMK